MLNIHLKIEAKKICKVSFYELSMKSGLSILETTKLIYNAFNIDAFMLQYKVQKLSKRARRNKI